MKTKKRRALGTYILDNRRKPVVERDVLRWSDWFERAENRVVRQDLVGRGVLVSTVFLGLDYNFWERGRPLLWETMIIGGRHDKYCQRYATREDALAGHASAVKIAKGRKSMMETDIARARFSPDFVDEVRSNVDGLIRELQLAPGETELGLAHLLGELLSLKESPERRHAEAQALHEYIVTLADETARSRELPPPAG